MIREEHVKGVVWTGMAMKKYRSGYRIQRTIRRIMTASLAAVLAAVFTGEVITVQATSISQIQQQIKEDQKNLDAINDTLSGLSDEQDLIEEMIADLNAEIINMMTSIGLKEEEIVAKEAQIANKKMDIEQAELDYAAAKKVEEEQYETMKIQIRYMYENNNISLLARVLSNSSFGAMISRAEYIEKVYQSSNDLLREYEETKNQVQELWDQLVLDKEAMEADRAALEADRAVLQGLKKELDTNLAAKKAESANYEAEIQRYKQQAAAAKAKIQQEQKELKKLQEEQKKQQLLQQQQQASGSYTNTGYSDLTDNASGSDLGKQIAKYACQFIGNPYVYGGTSLTNGADCSGFTMRIYLDFGYSLPRTSFEQRSAGRGVSYDQIEPGDIVCYSGHVGMYIGGGKIVHASNARSGIKVSSATYREILAIRRII